MAGFNLDASDFLRGLTLVQANIVRKGKDGIQQATDELLRVARDIAPISTGVLRASEKGRLFIRGRGIVGEVAFSATNQSGAGRFNYALWTHEYMDPSQVSNPGTTTDGYAVGPKYLERPLQGESDRLIRIMADKIGEALE